MNALVRFLPDLWWFLCHWHPVSVKWNSPRMLWRMAMRREQIEDAIRRGRAALQAYEATLPPNTPLAPP